MDSHHGASAGFKDELEAETVGAGPLVDKFCFSGSWHTSAETKGFQYSEAGFLMSFALGAGFIGSGDMEIGPG